MTTWGSARCLSPREGSVTSLSDLFPTPPLVHLPRVNKEVLEEEGSQWTDEQQKAMGSAVKSIEKIPKKKPKRRVVVPFNPSLPRTMGTKSTKKQVKKWLKDNPGKVFYD